MKINLKHRGITEWHVGNVLLHNDKVVMVTQVVVGKSAAYQLTDLETGTPIHGMGGSLRCLQDSYGQDDDILLNVELNEVTQ